MTLHVRGKASFSAPRSWKIFSRWGPHCPGQGRAREPPAPSLASPEGAQRLPRGPSAGAATEKADLDGHMMQSLSSFSHTARPGELSCYRTALIMLLWALSRLVGF